jgi:hypothetical protein
MAKSSSKANTSGQGPRGSGPSRAKPMVKKPGFGVNPGGMGKPGKATSGGGAQSNKYTKVPTVGGPPKTRVVSPDAVSNIGRQVGNHAFDSGGRDMQRPGVPLYTGTMPQVPMGNEVAKNVGRGGPGVGANVYASGGQACWDGPANQHGTVKGGLIAPAGSAPAHSNGMPVKDLGPSSGEIFPGFPGKR